MKNYKKLLTELKVGKTIAQVEFLLFSVFAILPYLCLVFMKKFFNKEIVFCRITAQRIGEFIGGTELFLRRLKNEKYLYKNIISIGYFRGPISNRQLLKMYKRAWFIIQNNVFCYMLDCTWLRKTRFHRELPFNSNEYYEFNYLEPVLSFTADEEAKGKQLLAKIGINENDWFVCFHSRDRAYLGGTPNHNDYRDCDVNNYLKAAEYIVAKGGFAIRMGAIVDKPLPKNKHPRIIDYAKDYRSDFMDVYLSAKCRFFLGCTAGLHVLPLIFGVPVAGANFTHLEIPLIGEKDIFISKTIRDIKGNRVITFPEIFAKRIGKWLSSNDFEKAGIEVIENTPDEILKLAQEMNESIGGKIRYSEEDVALQKRYHALIKPEHVCYGVPSKIGAHFLRDNEELLR